jgi:hypothetical protein
MNLHEIIGATDWSDDTEYGKMVAYCKDIHEPSSYIKCREFID